MNNTTEPNTTSIADRLRDGARGTKEWRVQNVMDGCYMMFFKHWQETEARQWFEDQQRRYPDSVRGYELALVDVKTTRDALELEAADELDRMQALVAELDQDAKRYRWLRQRDLETIGVGGVFAGMTPENIVLNGDDLDNAIDAALAKDGA